jgi:hypothetical protein
MVDVEQPRRPRRRRRTTLGPILAGAAAGSTFLFFATHRPTPRIDHSSSSSSHRSGRRTTSSHHRRLWVRPPSVDRGSPLLARYADPKSVVPRTPPSAGGDDARRDDDADDGGVVVRRGWRANCQIVYVLGVEGSVHHGFVPVVKSLAERQRDPLTGAPYHVVKGHEVLRAAIFRPSGACARGDDGGEERDWRLCASPMSDPAVVRDTLDAICPAPEEPWKKHVIIEGNSFPSGWGGEEFRVRRGGDWPGMTPEQIASSDEALNHPTNLRVFLGAFGPHVDVRFVVLHRPYLETVASHPGFDGGPERHSAVIGGFILLLARFLAGHMYGSSRGGGDGAPVPLWTLVCADRLTSRSFRTERELQESRVGVLAYLADFLGWPESSCPECFDGWAESRKNASPRERLGDEATAVLLDHAGALEAAWPPRRPEDVSPLQRCGLL